MAATRYRKRPARSNAIREKQNPASLATDRAGPHGDCGLRDLAVYPGTGRDLVQLFDLGALHCFGLPRLLYFRFFFAKPDQQILFFLRAQSPDRIDANRFRPAADAVGNNDLIEATTDATGRRSKRNSPGRLQSKCPARKHHVVFPAHALGDDQIRIVQYCVVSDRAL